MAANVDLEIFKEDNVNTTITIKNNGVAVDITGYTFYMTVRQDNATGTVMIQKTVTSFADPTSGQAIITMSTTDTSIAVSSSTNKYVYDIRMLDASDRPTVLFTGNFKVLTPVTELPVS